MLKTKEQHNIGGTKFNAIRIHPSNGNSPITHLFSLDQTTPYRIYIYSDAPKLIKNMQICSRWVLSSFLKILQKVIPWPTPHIHMSSLYKFINELKERSKILIRNVLAWFIHEKLHAGSLTWYTSDNMMNKYITNTHTNHSFVTWVKAIIIIS